MAASRRFAGRVSADNDAVRAAATPGRSDGRTEGRGNRLKTLERHNAT